VTVGTLIAGAALRALIDGDRPLVTQAIDLPSQLQPNGVDLTLASIVRFEEAGALGFADDDRRLPATAEVEFDEAGWTKLAPGPYRVTFNETVDLPLDVYALAWPRSSLLRMGVDLGTAFWDSGYRGRGQCLLTVHNPHGLDLRRYARVAQIVFFRLDTAVEKGYDGRYKE
jgi:dUTP pyrophosphatase